MRGGAEGDGGAANPHLHTVALDGAWFEREEALEWQGLGHLQTNEVAAVLERIDRHLRRKGLLRIDEEEAERDPGADPEADLRPEPRARGAEERAAAPKATAGGQPGRLGRVRSSPARRAPVAVRVVRARRSHLAFPKPLCVAMCGFTLHATTRAGGADCEGREALLRYLLRPPLGQDRLELRPDGSVRIHLKKPFADGALAVDMDPLSLLCRLATAVPPPRYHTVRYAGVLARASPWRSRIAPPAADSSERARSPKAAGHLATRAIGRGLSCWQEPSP